MVRCGSTDVTEIKEPSAFQVEVEVCVVARTEGARVTPLIDGYHPLCRFSCGEGAAVLVGLAALRLPKSIQPGECGPGVVVFGVAAADTARRLIGTGCQFAFVEGTNVVANVRVRGAAKGATAE